MNGTDSSLLSYFDAALVINLAERTDRRKSIEREFQKIGWKDYRFFPALRFDDAAGFKLPSWRGCSASHLECLRLAQKEHFENILIFEDDLVLSSSIPRLTPAIIETISKLDWDFLYFGHESSGDIKNATRQTNSVAFEPCSKLMCTHFYAVNKRIIPALIAHFERNASTIPGDGRYGPMLPDGAYNTFRRYNKQVNTYIANPKLGWQGSSRSDITPSQIDSIKSIRPFITWARNVKRFLVPH